YYLTDNMVLKAQVVINDIKVCIDLNGYTLTAAPAARAFDINSGTGVLTLMDSSTANTGKLRGFGLAVDANGGNIRVVSANLNLYDLTVSGGKITAADPNSSSRGGNIYSQTGVVLIDNAKVLNGTIETGGSIQRGGNICGYAKHTLIIKGENAKIAGGMLTNKSTNSFGGNIHSGTGGYLYIYDGEISGGYAKNGGNICWMNSDGTQRGTIHIYGGRILDTGKLNGTASGSNVEIYGSSSYQNDFYMYGGYIKSFDGSGSYNTITVYGGTLGINPRSATEAKKYVLAPCAVASYDAETKLYTVSHVNTEETCNICGVHDAGYTNGYGDAHIYTNVVENVTATLKGEAYTDLTAALAVAGEKDVVTMFADVAVDGYVDVYSVLDLNGHSLTATRVISAENSAAVLKDTVGTGTLSAEEGIITQADNGMLVIDPANNGNYVLETVEAVQKTVEIKDSEGNVDDDKIGIKFYIDKHSSLTQLDEAFKSEKGVPSGAEGDRKAYVRITVFSDELKDGSHSFVYGAEHLDAYASAWDAKIFTCQINGVKALGEYTVVAEVVSNGVVVAATEYVPA
ncbi:MAG: hypothetical protein J6Q54_08805, partial [Oscillospiraceae bacterium]|nr:hypothetical protein [Oscillospiraceae bacterium]